MDEPYRPSALRVMAEHIGDDGVWDDGSGHVGRVLTISHPRNTGLAERRRQDDIVLASGLDWTIVRPRVISDEPAGSPLPLRSSPHGTLTERTSRGAITGLLLAVIDSPDTYRRHIYP